MTEYRVKKINLNKIGSTEDYLNAVKNASIHYCNGLKEVRNYCGGKLHRVNYGYCGINGNIEYVAERIK